MRNTTNYYENQRVLDEGKLTGYAKAVGLGVVKFNGCLANDGHKGRVDASIRDGRKAGYFQVSSEHGYVVLATVAERPNKY